MSSKKAKKLFVITFFITVFGVTEILIPSGRIYGKSTPETSLETDPTQENLVDHWVWNPPPNLRQLSSEELLEALKNSPFAFIVESFTDIPKFLAISLLSIEQTDLQPWNRYRQPINDALLESIGTSAKDLAIPETEAEITTTRIYWLSLKQSLQLALRNNREIQQQNILLEQDRQKLREERAQLFPILSLTGAVKHQDDTTRKSEHQYPTLIPGNNLINNKKSGGYQRSANISLSLSYTYPLLWGTLQPKIRQAKIQVEQSELESEIEVRDVQEKIILAFYDIQRQTARTIITAQSLIRSTQNFQDATIRVELGKENGLGVTRAKVQMIKDQLSLIDEIAGFYKQAFEFASLLELPLDIIALPAAPFQKESEWNLSLEETILQAFKNRLELNILRLEQDKLQASLREAYAKALPTFSFKVSGAISEDFLSKNRYELSESKVIVGKLTETEIFKLDYLVGLFLDWSLQGEKSAALIRGAKLSLEDNLINFANQRDDIRDEVTTDYFDLVSNRKNLEGSQLEVEVARKALDSAQRAIQVGKINQNDLISAEEDFTNAQFKLLETIIGYNQSLTRLQRVTGNRPNPISRANAS